MVVHALLRDGNDERVSGYLGSHPGYISEALRHRQHKIRQIPLYAEYLDARVASYRDAKVDFVRLYMASSHQENSSKLGRLRRLELEKGLLKEVTTVQNQTDALLRCRVFIATNFSSFKMT